MARSMVLLVLLLSSSAVLGSVLPSGARMPSTCEEAYEMCIFGFEGISGLPTFSAGTPDKSFSPVSVFKDEDDVVLDNAGRVEVTPSASPSELPVNVLPTDILGHVDYSGEAFVLVDGKFIPISQWKCPAQDYSPSFFKAANLGVNEFNLPVSGIGHETPQTGQLECLKNLCVVLPFIEWQVFGMDGSTENVVSSPEDYFTNCAAFKINA